MKQPVMSDMIFLSDIAYNSNSYRWALMTTIIRENLRFVILILSIGITLVSVFIKGQSGADSAIFQSENAFSLALKQSY